MVVGVAIDAGSAAFVGRIETGVVVIVVLNDAHVIGAGFIDTSSVAAHFGIGTLESACAAVLRIGHKNAGLDAFGCSIGTAVFELFGAGIVTLAVIAVVCEGIGFICGVLGTGIVAFAAVMECVGLYPCVALDTVSGAFAVQAALAS